VASPLKNPLVEILIEGLKSEAGIERFLVNLKKKPEEMWTEEISKKQPHPEKTKNNSFIDCVRLFATNYCSLQFQMIHLKVYVLCVLGLISMNPVFGFLLSPGLVIKRLLPLSSSSPSFHSFESSAVSVKIHSHLHLSCLIIPNKI
jgi:hypothetical protein